MKSVLTRDNRTKLIATIYNRSTAFIQDIREIHIGKSRISLELQDVSPQIILDTLYVRDAIVHQQRIIHAVKDERELVNYFIGKDILFQGDGQLEQHKARVVSAVKDVVIQMIDTNQIVCNPKGQFYFPMDNFDCFETKIHFELTPIKDDITFFYGTRGLSWHMNYVIVVQGEKCRLKADCIIRNNSGMDLLDAAIHLMDGYVNEMKSSPFNIYSYDESMGRGEVETFSISGHHLLALPERLSIKNGEELLVNYFDISDIRVERIYTFYPHSSQCYVTYNVERHLDCLLPSGIVRVYEEKDQIAFVGESPVKKTLPNQSVRLRSGTTTNLSITNHTEILSKNEDYRYYRVAYTVKNDTNKSEKVHIIHRFDQDNWEMDDFNHDPIEIDGNEITFSMVVPANSTEQLIIEYTGFIP